jgi:phosphate transport system protein
MTKLMEVGIQKLTEILLEMASISERSVATAIQAYAEGGATSMPSVQVKLWADKLRDDDEEVSELAIDLIVSYQPVASDLRFIRASQEISYGFARFGRYAYDISQVLEMFGDLSKCDHEEVEVTAKLTKEMIRMSVEAFAKRDVELAGSIVKMDDFVDDKYRAYVKRLISQPDGTDLRCALSATLILRYLERIADHSSYIGDSVQYIVTGVRKAARK